MMTSTQINCPNCSQALYGQYCSRCGQNQKSTDRYFLILLNEAFEGIFAWNSKAWLTTVAMLFRPGLLTADHFANRRARYISPLRLYIITSLGFFLTLSLINFWGVSTSKNKTELVNASQAQTQSSTITNNENKKSHEAIKNGAPKEESTGSINYPQVTIAIPFLKEESEAALAAHLNAKLKNALQIATTNPQRLISKIIDNMPVVTFFLLPLYALAFKIFFLKNRRYYAEHLVLAVHTTCFLFVAYTLMVVGQAIFGPKVDNWLLVFTIAWTNIYLVLSFKRVHNENWPWTIAKAIGISWIYFILTVVGLICSSLIGIVLL